MIRLPKALYDKIVNAAVSASTEEICGLLGGEICGGEKTVKEIYFLENTEHSDMHFTVNPKEQLDAVRAMRKCGLAPLGNFHSHPKAPPVPSAEDRRLAYDSEASYLILSLLSTPCLRAFCLDNGTLIEEELTIGEQDTFRGTA